MTMTDWDVVPPIEASSDGTHRPQVCTSCDLWQLAASVCPNCHWHKHWAAQEVLL
ncbi:hypothetical protein [Tessaracoccus palaemonis]|uniref:LapB rubredoxin metal binding domain-containing protein n=1 Tax=Tessaracoccus palaemonis TaxID=2829499 RepID=A0ABX8SJX0_9ACTN|nr:hypothetical protein [Tessaracoccus palaemonis]QXT62732.1 hypothetical protein KDB89_13515 [Tessaracoccus palaemonis]